MSILAYDFNKDKKITTADVVYLASALVDKKNYNLDLTTKLVSVDGLIQQKITNNLGISENIKLTNEYSIIDNFSSEIITYTANPSFLFNINLNYLTSLYPDTYINLLLYHEISGQQINFAETKLGTSNTSFLNNNYNYNCIIDNIVDESNTTIQFKVKARYINENNILLDDENKPEIVLEFLGNNMSIIEIQNI